MSEPAVENLKFGPDGLIPAIVQDVVTGDVLMLAYMNDEAFRRTSTTRQTHFWSRSRNTIWRKGETSGHTQIVDEIRINCEHNSLLLLVRQTGAVCHTGYPTCYYRRIDEAGDLTIVRARAFDPSAVYGGASHESEPELARDIDALGEATRQQFGAYAYLRDRGFTAQSDTSRRLRTPDGTTGTRIADELRELAGVLAGEHRHADLRSDLRLEASQVLYWVLLQALQGGVSWARLRPDRALARGDEVMPGETVVRLLRAEAARWENRQTTEHDAGATAHATLHLVGLACQSGGLDPLEVVTSDLDELRTRPYLAAYFGRDDWRDESEHAIERPAAT
ncbi:MAG: phosphoribosyl-AMP cyclohydrolase [Chloroflexia bacterium]|nr:phosphoribosyl-AMP cyclohydrolase [Chloroflexia bacterium]